MNDHQPRFYVTPVSGGPWIVLDRAKRSRLVASCPNMDMAQMVAAFMNGDTENAAEMRRAVLAAKDVQS